MRLLHSDSSIPCDPSLLQPVALRPVAPCGVLHSALLYARIGLRRYDALQCDAVQCGALMIDWLDIRRGALQQTGPLQRVGVRLAVPSLFHAIGWPLCATRWRTKSSAS